MSESVIPPAEVCFEQIVGKKDKIIALAHSLRVDLSAWMKANSIMPAERPDELSISDVVKLVKVYEALRAAK